MAMFDGAKTAPTPNGVSRSLILTETAEFDL
jgi:hypothetical protein